MKNSNFKKWFSKYKVYLFFIAGFSVSMLVVFLSAQLFHTFRLNVRLPLLLLLPVWFGYAIFAAKCINFWKTIFSTAFLGALSIAAALPLLIYLRVYAFWYETLQADKYLILIGMAAAVSGVSAIFAAYRFYNYKITKKRIRRRARWERKKDSFLVTEGHPDMIKKRKKALIQD